jgi:hypothetical protein
MDSVIVVPPPFVNGICPKDSEAGLEPIENSWAILLKENAIMIIRPKKTVNIVFIPYPPINLLMNY